MLDPQFIRDNLDLVRKAITDKNAGEADLVDQFIRADEQRRDSLTELQTIQQQLNEAGKLIGPLMKEGKRDEAAPLIKQTARLKEQIKAVEGAARKHEEAFNRLMLEIPNIPHESVPVGLTPEENKTVFEWGEKPSFDFEPKPHWELAAQHGLIDFERGAKVTGAGFPFYIGKGARLQRALLNFFLDRATESGYQEIQPPVLINEESGYGTGQLPDKEGQMYHIGIDNLYLSPTAEVPLTNLYRNVILKSEDLPIKLTAYTPCFRREAGSYGKDVKGLNRLHQF
ncbi:MAG: serine--tRNA ligase, partial [Bacteroidetes bacterium]|nr:serine--tRNA ligase [Bacteroidota bacterium]